MVNDVINRTDQSSATSPGALGGKDVATRKRSSGPSFPIVGIGASAGGLEAFTQLLQALPLETGMGSCWFSIWIRSTKAR